MNSTRVGRLVFPAWLIVLKINSELIILLTVFTSTNRATDWSLSRKVIKIMASYTTNFIITSPYSTYRTVPQQTVYRSKK